MSPDVYDQFYNQLDSLIGVLPQTESIFLLGDFNAGGEAAQNNWSTCIGCFGVGSMNDLGQKLLELCCAKQHCVTNTSLILFMLEEMTFTKYRTQGAIQKKRKEKCGLISCKVMGPFTHSKIKAASIKIEERPITEQPNGL